MNIADLFFNINLRGGNETLSTINNLGRRFTGLGSKIKGMGSIVTRVGSGLTAGLTVPILGLVAAGVKYNATNENVVTSLTTLLGTEKKAAAMTQKIKELADRAPFSFPELANTTQKLLAYGIQEKDVIKITSQLGDVSLGNKENMEGMGIALAQVAAKGKLQTEELYQLQERGWNPLEQIMAKTGETSEEVRARLEKGEITYKELAEALEIATKKGGKFYKGMENASKTFTGQISILQSKLSEFLGDITKPLFDFLKNTALPVLTGLGDKLNGLSAPVKAAIATFGLLISAIGPITIVFGGFVILLGGVITAFGTIITAITTLVTGLGLLLIPITLLGGAFALLSTVMAGIGVWYLIDRFGSLKGIFEALTNFITISLVPAFRYLATGEGLGKVSENALITRGRLITLRGIMLEIRNFIVETLVPALQYLATGEGIEKVKVSSGSLRTELIQLRSKLVALRDFINGPLKATLRYLVTGDEGSLNKVKGMSEDTKNKIKDLRQKIKNLHDQVKRFDSGEMVKQLTDIIEKTNNLIDSIESAKNSIKRFFSWVKEKTDKIKSFIDSIDPELQPKERNLRGFAEGIINNPTGQFAWVGEKGPEIMYVPRGSNVYSNKQSEKMLSGKNKMLEPIRNNNNQQQNKNFVVNGDIIIESKNIKELNDIIKVFDNIVPYKIRR